MDTLENESVKLITLGTEKEALEASTKGPFRQAIKKSTYGKDPIMFDHSEIRKNEKRC